MSVNGVRAAEYAWLQRKYGNHSYLWFPSAEYLWFDRIKSLCNTCTLFCCQSGNIPTINVSLVSSYERKFTIKVRTGKSKVCKPSPWRCIYKNALIIANEVKHCGTLLFTDLRTEQSTFNNQASLNHDGSVKFRTVYRYPNSMLFITVLVS